MIEIDDLLLISFLRFYTEPVSGSTVLGKRDATFIIICRMRSWIKCPIFHLGRVPPVDWGYDISWDQNQFKRA